MFHESFRTLFWREFTSIKQGAEYFHVSKPTITRWLDGTVPINPMAEKLLLIKALGYLPNDLRWSGFRICEKRAVFITPSGSEFSPKELESFVFGAMSIVSLWKCTDTLSVPRSILQKKTSYRFVAAVE